MVKLKRERKHKIYIGDITIRGELIRDVHYLLSDEELARFEKESIKAGMSLDAYLTSIAIGRFLDKIAVKK